MKKIRLLETFSGVGTQHQALSNIGIEVELVGTSEIDEYAVLTYNKLHTDEVEVKEVSEEGMIEYLNKLNIPLDEKGNKKTLTGQRLKDFYEAVIKSNNLGDIRYINPEELGEIDLLTFSFPCQSISQAGKQRGFKKGSGTRSSLLWEVEKIIKTKKPKFLLMENVKNLVGKKFIDDFNVWTRGLEDLGYTNYWKVLNSKDYGIPQNRERVFMVSILGEHEEFKFPEQKELEVKLKDLIDEEKSDNYKFLTEEQLIKLRNSTFATNSRRIQEKEWCDTLCARDFKDPKCIEVSNAPEGKTNVRKLTPREYWRLTGFTDSQFNKVDGVVSNSQLYKQAGNAIVIQVLEEIFKQMFEVV